MPAKITWLGHSCFTIATGSHRLLIDPFLTKNDKATVKAGDVEADHILITHAHFDHIDDAVSIAQRTGATVLANFEITEWLKRQGVAEDNLSPLNPGGAIELPFGRAKATIAHHSSSFADGSYGGVAGGYLLDLRGLHIYIAGDTALFLDMKLIGLVGVDLAILPIGDRFTMGPDDAVEAIKLINPRRVLPCHYNTWPMIEQDAAAWAESVKRSTAAEPIVLDPGASYDFS